MSSHKFYAYTLIALMALSGCTKIKNPTLINNTDAVSNQLAEAATSVSDSLRTLAEVEVAANPKAKPTPPPDPNTLGMGGLASVEWSGPIEPILQKLATASHYKFKIIGRQPSIPVIVTISARNTPLSDLIRDIGFQGGRKADVQIFPSRKTLELRYTS